MSGTNEKLAAAEGAHGEGGGRAFGYSSAAVSAGGSKGGESTLHKGTRSGCELGVEQGQGQIAQVAKQMLFAPMR